MSRSLVAACVALAAFAVAAALATDNRRGKNGPSATARERRPERDKLLVIVIDG